MKIFSDKIYTLYIFQRQVKYRFFSYFASALLRLDYKDLLSC